MLFFIKKNKHFIGKKADNTFGVIFFSYLWMPKCGIIYMGVLADG
jgi:hypothetical protein